MTVPRSKIWDIVVRILLLILIVPYAWISIKYLAGDAYFAHGGDSYFIPWTYAVWIISIVGLILAFILHKRYPRLIGGILILLGILACILLWLQPPIEDGGFGIVDLFICCPVYLVTMMIGIYFFVQSRKRKTISETQNNQNNPQ